MPPLPPTELVLDVLRHAVLPPLLASAAVLAVFFLIGGRRLPAVGAALALIAGMAAGIHFKKDVLPWTPEEPASWLPWAAPDPEGDGQEVVRPKGPAWHWLPWAALVALVVGLTARVPKLPEQFRLLLCAAACALAAWLLVPADLLAKKIWLQPAFLLVLLIEWAVLEEAARRAPGGGVPLGLGLVFLGGAAVILHAGSARLADVATFAAASLAGLAVVAWWFQADTGGAMPGAVVLLSGLLLTGYNETFSDVPWKSFALAALAPLALIPSLLPPLSRLQGYRLRLLQILLLLVPVAFAVTYAMQAETLEFE